MAKDYKSDEYASRTFLVSMALIGAWIAAAFAFVILAD
jgi:hypothetical protein